MWQYRRAWSAVQRPEALQLQMPWQRPDSCACRAWRNMRREAGGSPGLGLACPWAEQEQLVAGVGRQVPGCLTHRRPVLLAAALQQQQQQPVSTRQ